MGKTDQRETTEIQTLQPQTEASSTPTELEEILKKPWEIDRKSELEKQQLYAQLTPMKDTLLTLSYENFSEEASTLLTKILECLKKLDPTNYNQGAPQIVEFVKKTFDPALKKWQGKTKQLDLDEVNLRLRQLNQLGGSYPGTEASQCCIERIQKIDLLLQKVFAKHPEKLKDYLNKKEQEIRTYREKQNQEHQELLEALLDPFVLTGDLSCEESDGGKIYYKEFEGERWIFKIMYGKPEYPGSAYVTIFLESNPQAFATYQTHTNQIQRPDLSINTIEGFEDKLTQGRFGEIVAEAKNNYKNESDHEEALNHYDLPKNRPVYYLRVFQETWDDTMEESLQSSMMMGSVLASQYPNLTVAPILFSDHPEITLKETIRKAYEQGTRSFYLDIQMHGLHHQFSPADNYETFRATDLLALEQEFPEATFHISTPACYGAGAREDFLNAFEQGTASSDHFSLFLQTKPEIPTLMGATGEDVSFGTYYDMILMQALLAGKTYGEAVHEADTRAKEVMNLDAEEIVNGQLITANESTESQTIST